MEKLQSQRISFSLKTYLTLVKPGIIMGNAITAIGGFALASKGYFDFWLFLAMLEGLSLIVASACVFNNYIDREADRKMARTRNRPLAIGSISNVTAHVYATLLGLFGAFLLGRFTNFLALSVALLGFVVYVGLYSFLKYRTVHGTLIGSVAGAVPPVVGYTAVTGRLDLAAVLIFGVIVMWQMPHFFAIAMYRLKDYEAAAIPVLPLKKGMGATKVQMLFYIALFIGVSSLLTFFGFTSMLFAAVSTVIGLYWFWMGIKGFKAENDQKWARQMFIFSLVAVMSLSVAIPFSV